MPATFQEPAGASFKETAVVVNGFRKRGQFEQRYALNEAKIAAIGEGDGRANYGDGSADPNTWGASFAALDSLWNGVIASLSTPAAAAGGVVDGAADSVTNGPRIPSYLILAALLVGGYFLVNGGAKTIKNVKGIFK